MRAHEMVVPLVLFALAFGGALLMRQPGAHVPERAVATEQVRAGTGAAGVATSLRMASSPRPESLADTEPRAGGASLAVERDADSSTTTDFDSEPPNAEPAADAQLASETLNSAIDTLQYSGSPDDRVRALRSLAATGRGGIEVARVRSSLHLAATDNDPDVAARAQEEYDALVERDDR